MLHVDEVLYVPGLKKKLLSIATLEDKGYWVIFKNRKTLMWAKGSHLSTAEPIGTRRGGLHVVTGQSVQALAHDATSSSELWHRRLGHLHYKALPYLQNMVCGMLSIAFSKNEICKGCMLGKNIKKAFPSSDSRAQGILDLVHSDVCGPMSSPSLSGCLYYVIFIDDLYRKCWIYFLKAKSDTFDKFKEYKAFIERQTRKHIRTLRTENGGEFESLQFEDFCKEAGIKRQLTVPYKPQQNGIAKRKNRTICEAAKAMMFDQDLPNSLWAEATSTVIYIQNMCPHAILEDKTLEEVFSGTKTEVGHLRIFGCPVYIHVRKEKRTKMEPSGKKGIFVGYSENSKAYRKYVPGQRQIEVSMDVTFQEEVAFKKSRELQQDLEATQPASPSSENEESDDQREEPHVGPSDELLEPAKELERTLEEPLVKFYMQQREPFSWRMAKTLDEI
jgi:transposase InsO family protein